MFGIAPGCFGISVVVPEQLVVHKPPNITFEDAATASTVYVTVYSAFGDLNDFEDNTKARLSQLPKTSVHLSVMWS